MTIHADLRFTEATTAHSENASLNTAAYKRVALTATGGSFVQISAENCDVLNLYVASGSIMCFPARAVDTAGVRAYSAAATVETAALAEVAAGRYLPLPAGWYSDIPVRALAKAGQGVAVKSCGTGSSVAATNTLGLAFMRLVRQ